MSEDEDGDNKVSVVIPAYNEEKHVSAVIHAAKESHLVDEVIVVDDGSEDETSEEAREAEVKVFRFDSNRGKGAAMNKGVEMSEGSVIVFLDGDLKDIAPWKIERLIHPTLNGYDLAKAAFQREAGRVTELTAKPLLDVFFPEMRFEQPLSGQIALKKRLAQNLHFEDGFRVDVALLIDAIMKGYKVKEVNIGELAHESKELPKLKGMAREVAGTIIDKAREYDRIGDE